MLRRLLLGLVKGVLVGGAIGWLLSFVFGGMSVLGAYAAAVLTGVVVALVAGKPIWARGAWIEVVLKGIAAALLSAGLLWGFRSSLDGVLSLGPLGTGVISQLPLVVLPTLAVLLSMFFEADNTDEAKSSDTAAPERQRVAEQDDPEAELELSEEEEQMHERRAHRG